MNFFQDQGLCALGVYVVDTAMGRMYEGWISGLLSAFNFGSKLVPNDETKRKTIGNSPYNLI